MQESRRIEPRKRETQEPRTKNILKKLLYIITLLGAVLVAPHASAQYYTWGSDPASLKWSTIRNDNVRLIYPDTVSGKALQTLHYIESVQPYIGYGFRYPAMRIPFVLHPMNFRSNGMVMWLPKRVEFLTSPDIDGYSMPWCKQLVAHEYRHAVQYNNLNRGVIRVLSYALGQQGSTIGLLFLPLWIMEGDAVMSETEMSSFGRGLQPSYTMEYRALGNISQRRGQSDKWFCGSYRDNVPDHYHLGYQIASYSYNKYGVNIWDKVANYSVRNPYVLFTTKVALNKFYDTSVNALFRETFTDLDGYWRSLPKVDDSSRQVTPMSARRFTTYSSPQSIDSVEVLALKEDFDLPSRFVKVNTRTGEEQKICYTGQISTRPAIGNGRVWWTEYRRSKLFEQKVNSQLCYMDMSEARPRIVRGRRNALYPTPIDTASRAVAWVEYSPDGRYSILIDKGDRSAPRRLATPYNSEIHGLAWDNTTQRLYVIVTDNSGMWIGGYDSRGHIEHITQGAYITLSNLRADNGTLYFGSIESGRDEVHRIELATAKQYRISTSEYGSFSPAPLSRDTILMTTYGPHGYHLAVQGANSDTVRVTESRLPRNVVNPPRKRWEVINLDTVDFTPKDSLHTVSDPSHRVRRYRKGFNLINIHSWMPVAFNPFDAVDEHNIRLNFGATLLSQNLLSNTEAYASYGWNSVEKSLVKFGARYFGLGVVFNAEAEYGGNQVIYSISQTDPETGEITYQRRPDPDRYFSVAASASLPLLFQCGYINRLLTLSTGWSYSNGMVSNVGKIHYDDVTHTISNIENIGYSQGLHKLNFGVSYSSSVRLAHRDFVTPKGYVVSVNYSFNPVMSEFSDLISLFGRIYTPGFAPHNSLILSASYQTSIGGYRFPSGRSFLSYKSSHLIPHGFSSTDIQSNNYLSASAEYQFPLCYPEGGIPSVIYFKRIRLSLGADYAQFHLAANNNLRRIYSYGGSMLFDINVFRQPAAATSTIKLSLYRQSNGNFSFEMGVGLPF